MIEPPSPLEVATGFPIGPDPQVPRWAEAERFDDGRAALEAVLSRHLAAGPTYVLFSGGRDSSAVLLLADHVARREGLDRPIPVTNTFGSIEEADEQSWQEQVIDLVRPAEWIRFDVAHAADLLGPVSRDLLDLHGPMLPAMLGPFAATCARLGHGTVLTGEGGDELFDGWGWRTVAHGHLSPGELRTRTLAAAYRLPGPVGPALARRMARRWDWLTPAAIDLFADELARVWAGEPLDYRRYLDWRFAQRINSVPKRSMAAVASVHGVLVDHPFVRAEVRGALARHGGRRGWPDRSHALDELVADVVPEVIRHRTSKAVFSRSFFGPDARTFAAEWDGAGLDESLVVPERLRSQWQSPMPQMPSSVALQAAWLAVSRSPQGVLQDS